MNCTDVFTTELKKKIDKTKEGRGGKGIYKRRNSRSYRVIIHYSTYLKILKKDKKILNNYERGYAVRVKPIDYFDKKGNRKKNFHNSLELGKNAFLYFKNINDWNKYKSYCTNFQQVAELFTRNENINNEEQWIGEYCKFITNTIPQEISLICASGTRTNTHETEFQKLKKKYGINIPKQAGLGNYDYDYASENEIENVRYQLSMMIFRVPKMKDELKLLLPELNDKKIKDIENHIINFCKKNKLYDLNKLSKIRALNKKDLVPICPLCLEKLNAKSFFEIATQDEGREEEDNTQSEIVLMHIEALAPGKFNHHTYNLGWGHKHCNTIQGQYSINETLNNIKRILQNQSRS